ncbi:Sialic acid TRAP transporter permease protein SiaT [Falsiruegeria litorea R37]|uniref:TRAP transporter large permease protein n=1 Tax=Falsiruegeria litorea R37 TaxID=1200284 RepID=A0A1Y5TUU4_9RHOB|nr:TRAP transporter large permease subunit [Falsiruegeria litorea]SLN73234.1 Sialic acid TRAP transporter permease protein SiaT [Falsiruegeria litorea R37]
MTYAFILFGLSIALLALRVNLFVLLLIVGSFIHLVWGDAELLYIVEDMWIALDKEVLLSIPLFLICGSVMGRGAIAARLIEIMTALTSPLPGGLAVATVMTCAVFAAISGSSAVTLIAVGSIAYPALLAQGYDKSFSLGALTTAGTLGVIIPPSIPMILYGIATETSIIDLFTAGILPGLFLMTLLAGYSFFVNRHMPRERFSLTRLLSALRSGIWSMLMPVILLGGIYSGYFSPTESAAVALAYAVIIEVFVHRELRLPDLRDVAIETTTMVGTIFPVLAIALSVNLLLTAHQAPAHLADWISGFITSKITFLLAINVLLLIVGCVMDMISAILILAPLLLALGRVYGIDPVHLGIIMTVNLEIGLLTPPVGINLIVAMTAFREKFGLICRSVLPFIAIMVLGLLVITFVPALSLILL